MTNAHNGSLDFEIHDPTFGEVADLFTDLESLSFHPRGPSSPIQKITYEDGLLTVEW